MKEKKSNDVECQVTKIDDKTCQIDPADYERIKAEFFADRVYWDHWDYYDNYSKDDDYKSNKISKSFQKPVSHFASEKLSGN